MRPFWIAIAAVAVLLPVLVFKGCAGEAGTFRQLRLASKHPDEARPYAMKLRSSKAGVALAFRDMDVFGGQTRGWSSWIVQTSPLDEEVEERLFELVDGNATPLPKRLEALWVLWKRTGDDKRLLEMFELVREPGPLAVGYGRGQLLRAFDDPAAQEMFNVPASEPLNIDYATFESLVPRAQADLSYAG